MPSRTAHERRYSPRARTFIARRMADYRAGRMRGSDGAVITDPRQALAIAHSEARVKGMRVPGVRR